MELVAILFDWGDTLVHFPGLLNDPTRHHACVDQLFDEMASGGLASARHRECLRELGATRLQFVAAYRQTAAEQVAATRASGREHRMEDRMVGTLRKLGCRCRLESDVLDAILSRYCRLLNAESRLVAGARHVLVTLAERYRLGVVSNYPYPPLVWDSLQQFGLQRWLDPVVISGDVGVAKPGREIFARALSALDARPDQVLFVGDDHKNDMVGGKAAGLYTAWLAPGRAPGRAPHAPDTAGSVDFHLQRLTDLLSLLGADGSRPAPELAGALPPDRLGVNRDG